MVTDWRVGRARRRPRGGWARRGEPPPAPGTLRAPPPRRLAQRHHAALTHAHTHTLTRALCPARFLRIMNVSLRNANNLYEFLDKKNGQRYDYVTLETCARATVLKHL